jgi:hypothetical protein
MNSTRIDLRFVLFSHHSRTDRPSSQHRLFSEDDCLRHQCSGNRSAALTWPIFLHSLERILVGSRRDDRSPCLREDRVNPHLFQFLLQLPRIAQRVCCRANPDLRSESRSEADVKFVREGRNSRKESKKGGSEKELRTARKRDARVSTRRSKLVREEGTHRRSSQC